MTTNSVISYVVASLLPFTVLAQQHILTLDEAKQRAVEVSENIQLARLAIEQARHGLESVRAERFPALELSALYSHFSETAGISLDIPGLPGTRLQFGDGNIYEAALSTRLALFTGFRLQSTRHAHEMRIAIAEEQLAASRNTLIARVMSVYKLAQLHNADIRIYDEQMNYLNVQRDMLIQLLAQGQLMPYDTLVLTTRTASLAVQRAGAVREYHNALLELAAFIDEHASFDINSDTRQDDQFTAIGLEGLFSEALKRRSDLRILELDSQQREALLRAEQSVHYPIIAATASYRYGRPGVDQFRNEWMNYYTAGVSMKWNIFAWGGDKHRIEARRIDVRSIQPRMQKLRRDIRRDIAAVLNDLQVLRSTLELIDTQTRQENEKAELLRHRLVEGTATAAEVVDAESSLTSARLSKERCLIQYDLKLIELAVMIGKDL